MCTPAPHPDLKFLPHMRHCADSTDLSVIKLRFHVSTKICNRTNYNIT